MSLKVWFITGCSSGFGHEIVLEILRRGDKVIATARNVDKLIELKNAGADVLGLDVTAPLDKLKDLALVAHGIYGQIDILINNAGFARQATLEELTPEETVEQFNTNVFGLLNVTRAFLPYFRAQRLGTIANVSSVGAWRGSAAMGIYAGSKWAVSGITESMAIELSDFGIKVCVIEPGYFRSNFLNEGNRRISQNSIADYEGTAASKRANIFDEFNNKQPGDVKKGSKVIVDVLSGKTGKEIPLRLVLGTDCYNLVKEKCESTLKLLEEWKDISASTDHDDVVQK